MSESPQTRASDEDRERSAENLREHFAAGRIGEDELAERLEAGYAARTLAELGGVVHDLPALPISAAARRAQPAEARARLPPPPLQQAGASLHPVRLCPVGGP